MSIEIEGVGELEGAKSKVTVKEMSNADLDEDFEWEIDSVSKKSNEKKYQIVEIFKANKKTVQNDIRKLFDQLKESQLK